MAHLGTFGAAQREARKDAEKDTFDFCGEQFVMEGEIPPMLMIQLGAAATGKIEEQEGFGAIWEVMRCGLTVPERAEDGKAIPEDASGFQRFYRLAVARCVPLEELIRLAMALFEAQAGRPTEQRPESSAGSLPTSTSSRSSASARPALEGYTRVEDLLAAG